MRICCPICGERDLREFHYEGSSKLIDRPEMGAGLVEFHDYLHLRDNPAGINEELWSHEYGCRGWLLVQRNTITHEIISIKLAKDSSSQRKKNET